MLTTPRIDTNNWVHILLVIVVILVILRLLRVEAASCRPPAGQAEASART